MVQDSRTSCFCYWSALKKINSFVKTQRWFRSYFKVGRHGNVPSCKTIVNWKSWFRNATTTQMKTCGSTKTVRTPENVERYLETVTQSPRTSARKQLALQISNTSLLSILHQDQELKNIFSWVLSLLTLKFEIKTSKHWKKP